MSAGSTPEAAGGIGLVRRLCTVWAIVGGCVLLAVVAVNVVSVIGAATVGKAFPGDFELTEIGVAIAAFSFLPYAQVQGLNVTADIFTARASRFWLSLFALVAASVALAFSILLLRQMYFGMVDQKTYGYTTAILEIPMWWGYAVALVSLALLILAAAVSLVEAVSGFSRR